MPLLKQRSLSSIRYGDRDSVHRQSIELLESRVLLAVVSASDGTLTAIGTDAGETFNIRGIGNGRLSFDGETFSGIDKIVIQAKGGNDSIVWGDDGATGNQALRDRSGGLMDFAVSGSGVLALKNDSTIGDRDVELKGSIVNRGNLTINTSPVLGGIGRFSSIAGSVHLGPGTLVSTRAINGNNHTAGNSIADSGDISIKSKSIVVDAGSVIVAHVDAASGFDAGKVTLEAENRTLTADFSIVGYTGNIASIKLEETTIRGDDIVLKSNAADLTLSDAVPEWVTEFLIGPATDDVLSQFPIPASVMIRSSESKIDLNSSTITGSGDVTIDANSVVDASGKAISVLTAGATGVKKFLNSFAAAYSQSTAESNINVTGAEGKPASISAAGDVSIRSTMKSTASALAQALQNADQKAPADSKAIGASVSVTDSTSISHAKLDEFTEVMAAGNVNVLATGETSSEANSTVKIYRDGRASIGVALGFGSIDVLAEVDGSITATGIATAKPIAGGRIVDGANALTIPNHGFETGDRVTYESPDHEDTIGSLVHDESYFVRKIDDNTISLQRHRDVDIDNADIEEAATHSFRRRAALLFDAASEFAVNLVDDSIAIANHGLIAGDRVIYSTSTGDDTAIGGLGSQRVFYAVPLNAGRIRLAESRSDALAGRFLDLTSRGEGTHALGYEEPPVDFQPATAVTSDENSIRLPNHGYADGDLLVYDVDPTGSREFVNSRTTLFNPLAVASGGGVDLARNSILAPNHRLETGQLIRYRHGASVPLGTSEGSLVEGQSLYVIRLGENLMQVATSRNNASAGVAVDLTAAGIGEQGFETARAVTTFQAGRDRPVVDLAANTIQLDSHGLMNNDRVTYYSSGGQPVGGLVDATEYFARVVDTNRIRLAPSEAGLAVDLTSSGSVESSQHVLSVASSFSIGANAASVVNLRNNSLVIPEHGLQTGDQVTYEVTGGNPIGGLSAGEDYFAIVVNENVLQLAESHTDATDTDGSVPVSLTSLGTGAQRLFREGTAELTFDPTMESPVQLSTDRITIAGHGFEDGEGVVYLNGGGSDIGGLTNGASYVVRVIDDSTIELEDDATQAKVDLTSAGTGMRHGLERVPELTLPDAPLQGLVAEGMYFVTRIDANTIRLADAPESVVDLAVGMLPIEGHHLHPQSGSGIHIKADLIAENSVVTRAAIDSLSVVDKTTKGAILARTLRDKMSGLVSRLTGRSSDKSGSKSSVAPQSKNTTTAAASIGYQSFQHQVIARVGGNAVLKAGTDVVVDASVSQSLGLNVEGRSTPNRGGGKFSVGAGVGVGTYENTVRATIEDGASIDASRSFSVDADLKAPFQIENLIGDLTGDSPTEAVQAVTQAWQLYPLFNTSVMTTAATKKPSQGSSPGPSDDSSNAKLSVTGSVAVTDYTNIVEARIGSGVTVNQDVSMRTAEQSVAAEATIQFRLNELVGILELNILKPDKWLQSVKEKDPTRLLDPLGNKAEKLGIGGSVLFQSVSNTTVAEIADDAIVHTGDAGSLRIFAEEDFTTVDVAQAGGASGKIGISGAFNLIDHDSNVQASIGSGIEYDGGAVSIRAADKIEHITIAGAVQKAGTVGLGVSGAIVDVDRETVAYVGRRRDEDGDIANDGVGSIDAGGDLSVNATSDGAIYSFSLAGTKVSPIKTKSADGADNAANAANSDVTKGSFGLGISGDVAIHSISDRTQAYVNGTVEVNVGGKLEIQSSNHTKIHAGSGAVTQVQQDKSGGIAGSYAQNTVTGDVEAFIQGATVNVVGNLDVNAITNSSINTYAASGQSGGKVGIAGQVTINAINRETSATLDDATIERASRVRVTANDESSIFSVSGAATVGGKLGIGAAIAINTIESNVRSSVASSDVAASGDVMVTANSGADIHAITVAAAAGKVGMQAAGSVSINDISGEIVAAIQGAGPRASGVRGGDITVSATDNSSVTADGGGVGIALGAANQGAAISGTVGVSVAINKVSRTTRAFIDAATVAAMGALVISTRSGNTAQDRYTIDALALAGAVSGSRSATASAGALAGTGAGARNEINRVVESFIRNSPLITAGASRDGDVTLNAVDDSSIRSDSGGFGVGLARGNSSAGAFSVGISVSLNEIGGRSDAVRSYIDNSNVQAGSVGVNADSNAKIDVLSIGGAIAGASGSGGTTGALAGAGAAAINTIQTTVDASIRNSNRSNNRGIVARDVFVGAKDNATITADVVGASIAAAAGAGSSSGALSVGVSIGRNEIDNRLQAYIDDSVVVANGEAYGVRVMATESAVIKAQSVAASLSAAASSSSSLAISGGGAEASNVILTNTNAYAKGSEVTSSRDAVIATNNTSTIEATVVAASAAVGFGNKAGAVSIGAARSRNFVGWRLDESSAPAESTAYVHNSQINVGGSLDVLATATQTINATVGAGSVAISGSPSGSAIALGGAGVQTVNKVQHHVKSYIVGADVLDPSGPGITAGDVTVRAVDSSTIVADAGAAALSVSVSPNASVAVSIGVALARNEISNQVDAYVKNVASLRSTTGNVTISAKEDATITARSAAAAAAIGAGQAGFAVSGAGADASNVILGEIRAYAANSRIDSVGDVSLDASNVSSITASVLSAAASLGIGSVGGAVSVGASLANNFIGFDLDGHRQPLEVLAYLEDAVVVASGAVTVSAMTREEIEATTTAAAVAVAGGSTGLAGAGSGVNTSNKIANRVEASIEGGRVVAGTVDVSAMDESTITALARAASVAAALAPAGAAIAIAVTLSENVIVNDVVAHIENAMIRTSSASGVVVSAHSMPSIQRPSDDDGSKEASAVVGAVSAGVVAAAAAGAKASNTIGGTTRALVTASDIAASAGSVQPALVVDAVSTADSEVEGKGLAVAAGLGSAMGAVLTESKVQGITEAAVGGSLELERLSVRAAGTGKTLASAKAVAGGLFGAGVNSADARVTSRVLAGIHSDARINVTQDAIVVATSSADADSESLGVAVGALAVGISEANVSLRPTVITMVGDNAVVSVDGKLSITSTLEKNKGVVASSASGGALLGVSAAKSSQQVTADVKTVIGRGVSLSGSTGIDITSTSVSNLTNVGEVKLGGGISKQSAKADETIGTSTLTTIGAGSELVSRRGDVNVDATNSVDVRSDTFTVFYGLGSGSAAESKTRITGIGNAKLAQTILGAGSSITASQVNVGANVDSLKVDSDAEGQQFVIGGEVETTSEIDIDSAATITQQPGATITADDIRIVAGHAKLDVDSFGDQSKGLGVAPVHAGTLSTDVKLSSEVNLRSDSVVAGNTILVEASGATDSKVAQGKRNDAVGIPVSIVTESQSVESKAHIDAAGASFQPGTSSAHLYIDSAGRVGFNQSFVGPNIAENTLIAGEAAVITGIQPSADPALTLRANKGDIQALSGSLDQTGTISLENAISRAPDRFADVTIENRSTKNVRVDGIDVLVNVSPTLEVIADDGGVTGRLIEDSGQTTPSFIDIRNGGRADVVLSGVINNPLGTTQIASAGGSIADPNRQGASRITTADLTLVAPQGHIGQNGQSVQALLAATATDSPTISADANNHVSLQLTTPGESVAIDVEGISSRTGNVAVNFSNRRVNVVVAVEANGEIRFRNAASIADAHSAEADFTARTLRIGGGGDVGAASNALESVVSTMEIDSSGGIFLDNALPLTIGGLTPDVEGLNAGGTIDVVSDHFIDIRGDIIGGDVRLTARDDDSDTLNQIRLAPIPSLRIESTSGDIALLGGDLFDDFRAGHSLVAEGGAGQITLGIDWGNAEVDAANVFTLPPKDAGVFLASELRIVGDSDPDSLVIPELFLPGEGETIITFEGRGGFDTVDVTLRDDPSGKSRLQNVNVEKIEFEHASNTGTDWQLDTVESQPSFAPFPVEDCSSIAECLIVEVGHLSANGSRIVQNLHSDNVAFDVLDVDYQFGQGADNLLVLAMEHPANVAMRGGNDAVTVGGMRGVSKPINPGFVNQPLILDGGRGRDEFILVEPRTSSVQFPIGRIDLAANGIGGLVSDYDRRQAAGTRRMIEFNQFDTATVNLGATNSAFTVFDTVIPTTIHGGGGKDAVNIRKLSAATTVDLGQGDDTINLLGGGGDLLHIEGGLHCTLASPDACLDTPAGGDRVRLGGTRSFDASEVFPRRTGDGSSNSIGISGNGWERGQELLFTTDGVAPAGLIAGNTYYAVPFGDSTIRLANSLQAALDAVPSQAFDTNLVDINSMGEGEHHLTLTDQGGLLWPTMVGRLAGTTEAPTLAYNQPAAELPFAVNPSSNLITTSSAHGFETGDRVVVFSDDELPGGLKSENVYLVTRVNATSFRLALEAGGAVTTVDIGTAPAGSGSWFVAPLNTTTFSGIEKLNVSLGLGDDTFAVDNALPKLAMELRGGPGDDDFALFQVPGADTVIRGDGGADDQLRLIVNGQPQPLLFEPLTISAGVERVAVDNRDNPQPVDWILSQAGVYFVSGSGVIAGTVPATNTLFHVGQTGLQEGDRVLLSGDLPTYKQGETVVPLDPGQFYYAVEVTAQTFKLALEPVDAEVLDLQSAGGGMDVQVVKLLGNIEGAVSAEILGGLGAGGNPVDSLSVVSALDATVDITGNNLRIIEGSRVLDHESNLSQVAFGNALTKVDGLAGVSSVVSLRDDASRPFVFAAGTLDEDGFGEVGKIAMFVRRENPNANPSSQDASLLHWVGTKDSSDNVPGNPHTLKLSPDERFLYVVGETEIAVYRVLGRGDGPELRYVETVNNAVAQGLPRSPRLQFAFHRPTDLTFSPADNGVQIYVTDQGLAGDADNEEDGILVFERNTFTGRFNRVVQKLRKENSYGKSVDVGHAPVSTATAAWLPDGEIIVLDEPFTQPIRNRGTFRLHARSNSFIVPLLLRPTGETDHTNASDITEWEIAATGRQRSIPAAGVYEFEFESNERLITPRSGLYFGWIDGGSNDGLAAVSLSQGTSSNAYQMQREDLHIGLQPGSTTDSGVFRAGYAFSIEADFEVSEVKGLDDPVTIAVAPDGNRLYTGDAAGEIATWGVPDGELGRCVPTANTDDRCFRLVTAEAWYEESVEVRGISPDVRFDNNGELSVAADATRPELNQGGDFQRDYNSGPIAFAGDFRYEADLVTAASRGLNPPAERPRSEFLSGNQNGPASVGAKVQVIRISKSVTGEIDAISLPFQENFDSLNGALRPAVTENISSSILGWSHTPPSGWDLQTAAPRGMPEWQGWSFTTRDFWTAADSQQRGDFSRASGVFAVADPDEWDDLSNAGSVTGRDFNTFLTTPDLDVRGHVKVSLSFDSHWRPEGTQTATVTARFDVGGDVEVLRFDSNNTSDNGGNLNESVGLSIDIPSGASKMMLTWGMTDAGNNWYWAVDNIRVDEMASEAVVPLEIERGYSGVARDWYFDFDGEISSLASNGRFVLAGLPGSDTFSDPRQFSERANNAGAVRSYFVLPNGELAGSQLMAGSYDPTAPVRNFGGTIAVDGNTAVISADVCGLYDVGRGCVFFNRSAQVWEFGDVWTKTTDDLFGTIQVGAGRGGSLLDIDRDTIITATPNSAVWIYERTNNRWQGERLADTSAIAVSIDGNIASFVNHLGVVSIYRETVDGWQRQPTEAGLRERDGDELNSSCFELFCGDPADTGARYLAESVREEGSEPILIQAEIPSIDVYRRNESQGNEFYLRGGNPSLPAIRANAGTGDPSTIHDPPLDVPFSSGLQTQRIVGDVTYHAWEADAANSDDFVGTYVIGDGWQTAPRLPERLSTGPRVNGGGEGIIEVDYNATYFPDNDSGTRRVPVDILDSLGDSLAIGIGSDDAVRLFAESEKQATAFGGNQTSGQITDIEVGPDGQTIYATDDGGAVYVLNTVGTPLVMPQRQTNLNGDFAGAASVLLNDDDRLYVAASLGNSVTAFNRRFDGTLELPTALSPNGNDLDGAADTTREQTFVVEGNSQEFLVVASSVESTLATFSFTESPEFCPIDAACTDSYSAHQGRLPDGGGGLGDGDSIADVTRVQSLILNPVDSPIRRVSEVFYAVDPVNDGLFVLNRTSDGLTRVVQHLGHGVLEADQPNSLSGASSVVVSSNGRFVYVATPRAGFTGQIAVYERQTFEDATGQIDGLAFSGTTFDTSVFFAEGSPASLTLSPDGRQLVASGPLGLEVLSLNTTTGDITGSVSVLPYVISDLKFVGTTRAYAVERSFGATGGRLLVLSRAANGALELLLAQSRDVRDPLAVEPGVGLEAGNVPHGRFVYVASGARSSITVFDEFSPDGSDTSIDGNLHRTQILLEGVDGVRGLQGVHVLQSSAAIADSVLEFAEAEIDSDSHTIIRDQAHGLRTGQEIVFLARSEAPGGAERGEDYYVRKIDNLSFQLFASERAARDGDLARLVPIAPRGREKYQLHTSIPAGAFLFALGRDANAIAVFERDVDPQSPNVGQLAFLQRIRNRVGNVTSGANFGLFQPDSIIVPSDDTTTVFVGSAFDPLSGEGGFVSLHNNADDSPALPAVELNIDFTNIQALRIATGGGEDFITVHEAASSGMVPDGQVAFSIPVEITTGDGADSLTLNDAAGDFTTRAELGGGNDYFTIRTQRTAANVDVDTGPGADNILVKETAEDTTLVVSSGRDDAAVVGGLDVIRADVASIPVSSSVTILADRTDEYVIDAEEYNPLVAGNGTVLGLVSGGLDYQVQDNDNGSPLGGVVRREFFDVQVQPEELAGFEAEQFSTSGAAIASAHIGFEFFAANLNANANTITTDSPHGFADGQQVRFLHASDAPAGVQVSEAGSLPSYYTVEVLGSNRFRLRLTLDNGFPVEEPVVADLSAGDGSYLLFADEIAIPEGRGITLAAREEGFCAFCEVVYREYAWDLNRDGVYTDLVTQRESIELTWQDLVDYGYTEGGIQGDVRHRIPLRVTKRIRTDDFVAFEETQMHDDEVVLSIYDADSSFAIDAATEFTARPEATSYSIDLQSTSAADPVVNWSIAWGDGEVGTATGASVSPDHFYQQPGSYVIQVTGRDVDGNETVTSRFVTVQFDANSLSAGGPYDITEGEGLTLNGTVVGSPESIVWTFPGGAQREGAASLELNWNELNEVGISDQGQFNVTMDVRYKTAQGGNVAVQASPVQVNVANVAPTARLVHNAVVLQGETEVLQLIDVVDPNPSDEISFSYRIDGGAFMAGTADFTLPNLVAGDHFISARISDGTDSTTYFASVKVEDVPSRLLLADDHNSPVTVSEGGQTDTVAGTFENPGGAPVRFLAESGSASIGTVQHDVGSGEWTWSFTSGDGDSIPQEVVITMIDQDNQRTSVSFDLVVDNRPPVAAFAAPAAATEGSVVQLAFSDAGDVSTADTNAGFQYFYDFGDGQFASGAAVLAVPPELTADDGVVNVAARIVDKDGGTTEFRRTLTITNVAPQLVNFTADTGVDGVTRVTGAYAADAGIRDELAISVEWGDGCVSGSQAVGLTGCISSAGSGYADEVFEVPVSGGSGTGMTVNIRAEAGSVSSVSVADSGMGYVAGDVLSVMRGATPGDALIRLLAPVVLDEANRTFTADYQYAASPTESLVVTIADDDGGSDSRSLERNGLDCNGDGLVDAGDLSCVCATGEGVLDDLLEATGLLRGDVNGDGIVEFTDFLILSGNFGGQGAAYNMGDVDCDGEVGFTDFLTLSGNFGREALRPVAGSSAPITEATIVDLGEIVGDATYAFALNMERASGSTSIAGSDTWGLKLDQWRESGVFGITEFGVRDHFFEPVDGNSVDSIFGADFHVVFASDDSEGETRLYIDGTLSGVIEETLGLSGAAYLMASRPSSVINLPTSGTIYEWATYDSVLSDDDIADLAENWSSR